MRYVKNRTRFEQEWQEERAARLKRREEEEAPYSGKPLPPPSIASTRS